MIIKNKALLLPVNENNEVLIQDRENYKPPRWGFFGGSIEEGETPIEAVIRETKEELGLDLKETELFDLGIFKNVINENIHVTRHAYLYRINLKLEEIHVIEGKGAKYENMSDAKELIGDHASDADVKILEKIEDVLDIK